MKRLIAIAAAVAALGSAPSIAADVAGSATGTFQNAVGTSGLVTTGLGTSAFTYGDGSAFAAAPSSLTFVGSAFSSALLTPFKVGTLSYFNGTTALGTEASAVDLALHSTFTNPSLGLVNSVFTLGLTTTANVDGEPNASADFVSLANSFVPTVFDIGGTQYTVKLTGFVLTGGSGFLDSNNTAFHVLEGGVATADLYAEVTSAVPAVPEPGTWAMMILGFAGVGVVTYRRRKTAALAA
ncbi:MAG: choice-of-anchor K domain-containing protein [Pseudomonadota bacterium]